MRKILGLRAEGVENMVLVAVSAVSQGAHCWFVSETGWIATVH